MEGLHLWLRMLFSCLVDADFLDTEGFMDGEKSGNRRGWPELPTLLREFDDHMERFDPNPHVNEVRAAVLQQCRDAASREPGRYSLTVPTGGGKTLASLAFALNHARAHGKHRIIYVIPYTSIIEQTANVFRDVFPSGGVVEHHSNAETDSQNERHRSRLACENWDAPIIVTTSVPVFRIPLRRPHQPCAQAAQYRQQRGGD